MLVTSHILATLVVGKAVGLNKPELYTALAGGAGVDLDHAFVNRKWLQDIEDFVFHHKITYGITQHSWIQEYLFGTLLATALGLLLSRLFPAIRWWVLPLFLLIHISMDAVMRNVHMPFVPLSHWSYVGWLRSGTIAEIIISSLGLVLFYLLTRA